LVFLKIARDSFFEKDKNYKTNFPKEYSAIITVTMITIIIYSLIELLIVTAGLRPSVVYYYISITAVISVLSVGFLINRVEKIIAKSH
jgi:hypothetical protein